MALTKTTTGEYLKIVSFQSDFQYKNYHISCYIFKDADQRARFEGGLNDYEYYKQFIHNAGSLLTELAEMSDNTKSIEDNIKSAGYKSLKQEQQYSDWVDC